MNILRSLNLIIEGDYHNLLREKRSLSILKRNQLKDTARVIASVFEGFAAKDKHRKHHVDITGIIKDPYADPKMVSQMMELGFENIGISSVPDGPITKPVFPKRPIYIALPSIHKLPAIIECFSIIITSATLEKLYVETFVSKNNLVAKDLQCNLETGLRFGKSIDKSIGMYKLIQEAWQQLTPKQKGSQQKRPDQSVWPDRYPGPYSRPFWRTQRCKCPNHPPTRLTAYGGTGMFPGAIRRNSSMWEPLGLWKF